VPPPPATKMTLPSSRVMALFNRKLLIVREYLELAFGEAHDQTFHHFSDGHLTR
jgi:hypothetical protein